MISKRPAGRNRPTDGNRPGETPREDGTTTATHYVLGGGALGAAVATRLRADGHSVALIDESEESAGIPVAAGDPADTDVLDAAGVTGASTVVVATRSDRRNLLIAQLVRARFDPARVLVLVHDPPRLAPFADAGHEPICATTVLSEALAEGL